MINTNSVSYRDAERDEIARAVAAFERSGKEITKIPRGVGKENPTAVSTFINFSRKKKAATNGG